MEGMEAVKFEGGRSDRKRELEELIKASHLNFIALSMPQVLNDYIYIMISSQGKERTCGSIAAKAFQPALIDSTSTFNSWWLSVMLFAIHMTDMYHADLPTYSSTLKAC